MYILGTCVSLIIWVTRSYLFIFTVSFVATHSASSPDRGSVVAGTHAGSAGNEAVRIAMPYQPCSELYNYLLADFPLLSLCVRGIGWTRDCLCFFSSSITIHREIFSPLEKAYIRKSRRVSIKAGNTSPAQSKRTWKSSLCFPFFSWCWSYLSFIMCIRVSTNTRGLNWYTIVKERKEVEGSLLRMKDGGEKWES